MQVDVFKNQLLYFDKFFNVRFYKKYSSFSYPANLGLTFIFVYFDFDLIGLTFLPINLRN